MPLYSEVAIVPEGTGRDVGVVAAISTTRCVTAARGP